MNSATVHLWGELVGAVTWLEDRGHGVFEYDKYFVTKGLEVAPFQMPISAVGNVFSFPSLEKWTFKGLPGLLANSLPDDFGNSIIDEWLIREGRDPNLFNPVERLCYIGQRGMGALEYSPAVDLNSLNKPVPVEIENLLELVQEVLVDRTCLDVDLGGTDREKADAMLDILRVGVSAGGAVPKAIIGIDSKNNVCSGQTDVPDGYRHWIIKFDGVDPDFPEKFGKSRDDCRVEYAYYLMAKDAGIEMFESKLFHENGRSHFMTKRFDRIKNAKIHVLSFACLAHLGFNPPGAVGYESLFQYMRMLHIPYPTQEQQYRRMVFNVIAMNLDHHVKNASFMMGKDGVWKLSPAYDVMFTHNPREPLGTKHKMSINGKVERITTNDLEAVAKSIGIKKPIKIIEEVRYSVSKWPEFAKIAGVRKNVVQKIRSLHLLR